MLNQRYIDPQNFNYDANRCKQEGAIPGRSGPFGVQSDGCSRQTAKGVISDRIFRLRKEAASLEALIDALPGVLPPEADQALWDLVIGKR